MKISNEINRFLRAFGVQLVRTKTLDQLLPRASEDMNVATDVMGGVADYFDTTVPPGWEDPLAVLRTKWGEIPAGDRRQSSGQLLRLSDRDLLTEWERARDVDTQDLGFDVHGWYHELYRPVMPGKRVLDVGCGMALSTLTFAEMGARLTFIDIIPENIELVRRLCKIKQIDADFLTIDSLKDFDQLPEFDVVAAIGSLINAPLAITRLEVDRLKMHLRPGGRWLHLAYPKSRWEQEGRIEFAKWGEHTDGPGTPWMEYHDRSKMTWLFEPSVIRILFECEWHDRAFNWFDIELVNN